jgi:CspA family cold shock protein
MIGKVAWWSNEKGFGFLSPINGTEDVFCHHTGLAFGRPGHKNLMRDSIVEFEVKSHNGRSAAANVRLIEDEPMARSNTDDGK